MATVEQVIGWLTKHRAVALALAAAVGSVLAVAVGAYAVVSFGKFIDMLKKAGKAFGLFGDEAAAGGEEAAVGEAAAEAPLLPWIAAIALVGVAAYELYEHWSDVWSFIKRITADAWDFIKAAFSDAVSFVKRYATEIGAALMLLGGPFTFLIGAALLLWKNWRTIWDAIKAATSAVWAAIKAVFDALITVVKVTIVANLMLLQAAWNLVWTTIKTVTNAVWATIKAVFDALVAYLRVTIITPLQFLLSIFQSVWRGVLTAVQTAWSSVRAIFQEFIGDGITVVQTAIQGFETAWSNVWSGIETVVEDVWSELQGIFADIKSGVQDVTNAVGKVAGIAKHIPGASLLGKLASGGPASANTPYIIGEEGPEIFVPKGSGTVLPNSVFAGTGGGTALGGGGTALVGRSSGGGSQTIITQVVLDGQVIAQSTKTILLQQKARGQTIGLS
jgi:hypothetical protein